MKDLFSVWGNTRQIAIIALTAAIYAGMLIPFKAIQIVPGLTVIIGFGVQILGLAPFKVLFTIIFINNSLMSSVLGVILIKVLYKRIERTGLLYTSLG